MLHVSSFCSQRTAVNISVTCATSYVNGRSISRQSVQVMLKVANKASPLLGLILHLPKDEEKLRIKHRRPYSQIFGGANIQHSGQHSTQSL